MFWPSGGGIPSETSRITASGSPDALGTGPSQVTKADLDNLENLVPDLENKIFKIGLGHRPRPGDQDRS